MKKVFEKFVGVGDFEDFYEVEAYYNNLVDCGFSRKDAILEMEVIFGVEVIL